MKKLIFTLMLLLAAVAIADVVVVSDTPEVALATAAAKTPWGDMVLITAALAASILTVVQGIKKLLESPLLVWLLRLTGHSEVIPFISIALTVLAGVAAGIVTYQADSITVSEIISIIMAIVGSWGGHDLLKKKAA